MSIFAHKAMFIVDGRSPDAYCVDIGNETYTLHFTETYLLYFIPHQRPSMIGTVHVKPSGETFRFSADEIADETIGEAALTAIIEVFGNNDINDTVKDCIKIHYHQLLRERNQ